MTISIPKSTIAATSLAIAVMVIFFYMHDVEREFKFQLRWHSYVEQHLEAAHSKLDTIEQRMASMERLIAEQEAARIQARSHSYSSKPYNTDKKVSFR